MAKQAEMFTTDAWGRNHVAPHRPIAANADPETSHLSAREHARSGRLGAECQRVLSALAHWPANRTYPGPTSRELAEWAGMDRHMVAKRLSDLETAGHVRKDATRKCSRSGRLAVTWVVA